MNTAFLPGPPEPGAIVRMRQRSYLVENITPPPVPGQGTAVELSCIDDDAQGETLTVLWEYEVDTEITDSSLSALQSNQVDPPARFAAYLHTLRWNCVTSTDPKLLQAPWRAGIEVMAYQLEPLRKALRLPRVNLFIADDVGLGKTIEAGLVLRELLVRQRVRRVIVAVPPSIVRQWQTELEQRFGITAMVYDRDFVAQCRRHRGYSVNPWETHTRFIVSHALLRNEEHLAPLRDLLAKESVGSMLILDEAHNAAPAHSSQYAIDSQFTRAVRDIAELFEHRLFLSATPHNGLSSSFSALLELLDPQRFVRGTPVDPKLRDEVMVRRLKSDLRAVSGGFPERQVIPLVLDGLPDTTPELILAHWLDEYATLREARLAGLPPKSRAAQGLVLVNLQKRLCSSIEAFARTLAAHRRSILTLTPAPDPEPVSYQLDLLTSSTDPDDDRADLDETVVEAEEEQVMTQVTAHSPTGVTPRELELLELMETLAQRTRRQLDARMLRLIQWIREYQCPGLPELGAPPINPPAAWLPRRVVLFTEYADTKRYVENCLRTLVSGTDLGHLRVKTFHGGMSDDTREDIKTAFNADPETEPLRILICTDAAREGVNLQNHCADLFHLDLPWNPSRMEQRNGRIDRKLQRADIVRCHYFVYAQRTIDRVLQTLVDKTKVIAEQLGSVPAVLEQRWTQALVEKTTPTARKTLLEHLCQEPVDMANHGAISQELEQNRERSTQLHQKIEELRKILDQSQRVLDWNPEQLLQVCNQSLELSGNDPLVPISNSRPQAYHVPDLGPRWADTLDLLRPPLPRPVKEKPPVLPPRPVVFLDPGHIDTSVVHLHLEHRFVRRLLNRFVAQGFVGAKLARACVAMSPDPIPRVLLLARLSLYGPGASRLHDEIISLAARWIEPSLRTGPLAPYAEDTQEKSWDRMLEALSLSEFSPVDPAVIHKLLQSAPADIDSLHKPLLDRCHLLAQRAKEKLQQRADIESRQMEEILDGQRKRIERELGKFAQGPQKNLDFGPQWLQDEQRQLADNAKTWRARLDSIPAEKIKECARIQNTYSVVTHRVERVGIVWLWPRTG